MSYNIQDEREQRKLHAIQEHARAAAPIIADLRKAGYAVQTLDELRRSGREYSDAIPILLSWLPRIDNLDVKESIVRGLSVPWAKPIAVKPLIEEFHRVPTTAASLRWAIGNALEVIADDSVLDDILEIVSNPDNGTARQMFVLALGKLKRSRAVGTLIKLLQDEDVVGHAAEALGKLKAVEAKSALESLRNHPKSWVRKAAATALSRITKEEQKRQKKG